MMIFFAIPLFFMQAQEPTLPTVKATPQKKEPKAIAEMMAPSRSVMLIDPKERAADYQKAFELLRGEKSTSKVYFEIADGSKISNVIDMKLMPGNTLVIFRYSTSQGIKYQVVGIEDILGIMHQ